MTMSLYLCASLANCSHFCGSPPDHGLFVMPTCTCTHTHDLASWKGAAGTGVRKGKGEQGSAGIDAQKK